MDSASPSPLPGQRMASVEQAFALATGHHGAGRRSQAEALLRQIVDVAPRHAPAWQLLAVLAHEAGDTTRGIELLGRAIQANPLTGQFYSNRGEMHRLTGNLEQAIADGEQAVRIDPKSSTAHSNLGIALYHRGDLERAEACQQQALRLDPDNPTALNNLGSILRDRKDRAGAADMYRRVLARHPEHAESANNLGAVLTEMDNPEAGLKILLELIRRRPDYAEAHYNIGNALQGLENFTKAEMAFSTALRLQPGHPEAREGLARSLQEQRRLEEAENHVQQALAQRPTRASSWSLLGNIQAEQGYAERAEDSYGQALALNPGLVSAHLGLGHLHMETGRMTEAEQSFLRAHALDPASLTPRLSLTQVRKTRENDENFTALMQASAQVASMPETQAMTLHFALGKALEDLKRYEEAFPHFLEGCRLKRKRTAYSADNQDLIAANICATFTPERIAALRGGVADNTPIFVLGMPRSGTTLTETIIASHPDVYGAGELPDLLRIVAEPAEGHNAGYPLNLQHMKAADIQRFGEQYVAGLRKRAPQSRHITDKMPANFMAVGMIHLMLPNAKIVHIRRNAVDTCVSGFTRLFNKSQHHSYDLREIGRYYRNYDRIMTHWRQVLPAGSFYELQYEQLVANQEEESRKLIAYCGLEWNDACLSPDKTERTIKTASITQVRQPVYQSSVERWRVYEKFLGPLLEELGDLAHS